MLLDKTQVEQYKDLTIHSMPRKHSTEGVRGNGTYGNQSAYNKAVKAEDHVRSNYQTNLPFYIAYEHHVNSRGLDSLSKELGISLYWIRNIFDYFSIPRLTLQEANKRNIELGKGCYSIDPATGEPYNRGAGIRTVEQGLGIHGRTRKEMQEDGRKGGRRSAELGVGVHGRTREEMRKHGIKGGRRAVELGAGIHGLSDEERRRYGEISGRRTSELGLGIHAQTAEEHQLYASMGGRRSVELGVGLME